MSASTADEVPLARLFAMAYRLLIERLHERLRALGWTDVRPAFGFALLAARDRPTTSTGLAVLMGTTKQATSKLIAAMVAAGYLQRAADGDDARQRPLEPSARGLALLEAVETIYRELEGEWAAVIGTTAVGRIRRDLDRVLRAGHGGALPPVRPAP